MVHITPHCTPSTQEGATDVAAALYEWFTEDQLVTDKAAFIRDIEQHASLQSLANATSIHTLLNSVAIPGGTLDIHSAPLTTASAEFKVR